MTLPNNPESNISVSYYLFQWLHRLSSEANSQVSPYFIQLCLQNRAQLSDEAIEHNAKKYIGGQDSLWRAEVAQLAGEILDCLRAGQIVFAVFDCEEQHIPPFFDTVFFEDGASVVLAVPSNFTNSEQRRNLKIQQDDVARHCVSCFAEAQENGYSGCFINAAGLYNTNIGVSTTSSYGQELTYTATVMPFTG